MTFLFGEISNSTQCLELNSEKHSFVIWFDHFSYRSQVFFRSRSLSNQRAQRQLKRGRGPKVKGRKRDLTFE